MDDKNSARRELGFARWYNEIERRFSLSDAGGARNEGGAASRGNALPPPSIKLLAGRGAAGMKSGLRFAAVALLFLAGLFGVCEAARAQTVIWSATLEAGSRGSDAGYHRTNGYGTLSNTNFTYKGKSFTVDSFYTITTATTTYLEVPASGPKLTRDLFGTSSDPKPVTLHAGSNSWMVTGQGVSNDIFASTIAVLFDSVFTDGNTYAVSITTTEPGAPQGLTMTDASSSGVTLNWSAPSSIGGSAITGYKYRYKARAAGGFGDWTAIPSSASLTSYAVGDLDEYTEYTFQMLAVNDSGDGLYSGEATGRTLPGQPTVTLVLDRNLIGEDRGVSTVTATLDQPSTAATTVMVSASAVAPAMASNFTLSSNKVLTIAAEQTTSTGAVTITAVNNTDDDDNRQVTVSGVAANTEGITQPSSQTLTIADDESASTKVTLTVSPTRIQEGATGAAQAVTVTAELDGDAREENTQVAVSVSGDTAVAGTDYTAVPEFTFTIAAGRTSGAGTFTLAPIADNLDGPDVTVTVTGTTTSGLPVEPESGLTVTIEDDDDAPAATLVLDPDSIVENGGVSTVTATLDHPSIEDISIAVSASPLFPAEAGDFTLSATKTLTITAGQTTSTGAVTITANNDDVSAPDKSVTVSGEATSEGDLTPPEDVTLTITDDDEALAAVTAVTLTVDRTTVAEDAAASARTVTVTATLDAAAPAEGMEVTVSVTGGSAVAGTDYSTVDDFTVMIAAGDTSGTATFTLTPVDDNVDEPGETVVVTGTTTASGVSVAPVAGVTVTITDNDPHPEVTVVLTPETIAEAGGESTVTATLDRPSSAVTTITVSHTRIPPTSSSDFTLSSNKVLTIAAGRTTSTGTVTYTAVNNDIHQPMARHLVVRGSAGNSQGVKQAAEHLLTIVEDDVASTKVTLSVSPVSVSEGGGARTVTVTATLDEAARASGTPVRVSVSGGSAVAGTDFSAVEDFSLRIRPGRTVGTGTFTLTPLDDEVAEPDETVTVTGTTPDSVGLPVEPESGLTVTIADDDAADESASTKVTLTVSPTSVAEDATGADRTVTVTAELDGDARAEATEVTVSVSGDSAVAGTDYTVVPNFTMTIEADETSGTATFTLAPVDDDIDEPHETVTVTGTTTSGLSVVPSAGLTVTIADNDATPTVTLVLTPESISEERGVSTVTATLDHPSSLATTIAVSATPVSPAVADDFALSATKTLTIAAGAKTSTGTVTITANDNDIDFEDKTVTVSGSATNTQGITLPETATLTISDNEATSTEVTLTVSPTSLLEGATGAAQTVTVTAALDAAARVENTEVTVSVAAGTAVEGTDFSTVSDFTLTIGAGATSGTETFTLALLDDDIDEPDETVTVTGATTVAGLTVKPDDGRTVTITDDDATSTKVTLTVSPRSVSEGATDDADRTVTVTATLDAAARTEATEVTVSVAGGSAVEGTDFSEVGDITVTIAANQTSGTGTFVLEPANDDIDEPAETVLVTGATTASGLSVAPSSGLTVTIEDDDATPEPTLVLDSDSIGEDAGESTVSATLDRPSSAVTTIVVSATPVSPAEADDFTLSSNKTLTIAAGDTTSTGTVTITGVNNSDAEAAKSITVTGAAMNNHGVTQPSSRTLTITDDETSSAKVTLTVSPTSVAEDATGTDRTVTVTATLDGDSRSENTEVTVSVAAGTAVEGTDFSAVNDFTLTIAGGATSGTATFDLVPLDDNIDEPDETVIVSGTTTASGLTVEPSEGVTLTIEDDEAPPVISLILTPESISEYSGASTVTAQLSHPSSEAVRVGAYMLYPHLYDGIVADWSANRYLTFAPEQTASTGVVTITAIDNEVDNPDRVVPIKGSLGSAVRNRGITFPEAAYLTVVDDEEASTEVTLTVSPASVAEDATGSDRTVTVTATLDAAARTADARTRTVTVSVGGSLHGTAGGEGTGTFTLAPVDDDRDDRTRRCSHDGGVGSDGVSGGGPDGDDRGQRRRPDGDPGAGAGFDLRGRGLEHGDRDAEPSFERGDHGHGVGLAGDPGGGGRLHAEREPDADHRGGEYDEHRDGDGRGRRQSLRRREQERDGVGFGG